MESTNTHQDGPVPAKKLPEGDSELLEKQAAMVKHLTFEELTDCPDYIASLEQVVALSASEDWFE